MKGIFYLRFKATRQLLEGKMTEADVMAFLGAMGGNSRPPQSARSGHSLNTISRQAQKKKMTRTEKPTNKSHFMEWISISNQKDCRE
jgi:hypothetical protein